VNGPRPTLRGVPVEDFLSAIGEQLDRAQDSLAIKARTGRPLTWALREMKLALQVFIEVDSQGHVLWRTAGPNEAGASTVNLEFTTITRPMIEENTYSVLDESDSRSFDTLGAAADLSDEERIRLRRLGVRTVGQFRRLASQGQAGLEAIADMASTPVEKLEMLRRASARPSVTGHEPVRRADETLLRVHGQNLSDGTHPEVRLAGEPVEVLEARPTHLLVRPLDHHSTGQIEVMVNGDRATGFFRLPGAKATDDARRSAIGGAGPSAGPNGAAPNGAPTGGAP